MPWICECPRGKATTVYVPTGSKLQAHCDLCGAPFRLKTQLASQATLRTQTPDSMAAHAKRD
jgi:hypothetical protein